MWFIMMAIGVLGDNLVKKDSYFHYIFSVIFLFYSYFLTPEIPIFLFSETHLQLDALYMRMRSTQGNVGNV